MVASASTSARVAAPHVQLVGRISSTGASPASGGVFSGADIMAGVVGLLAIMAFFFMIVTFARRRTII
jgi:hypothetical protein